MNSKKHPLFIIGPFLVLIAAFSSSHTGAKTCNAHRGSGVAPFNTETDLYVVCNDGDPLRGTNTWGTVNLGSKMKTTHGPSMATDGKKTCISFVRPTARNERYDLWIGCNERDPLNVNDWQITQLSPTKTNMVTATTPSLATDGKRWCLHTKDVSNKDLWVHCTDENGDPLNAAHWTSVKMSWYSTHAPSISTDGKRWCGLHKSQSNNDIWITCTERDPLNPSSWSAQNLNPFHTRMGPALATNGKKWCTMVVDGLTSLTGMWIVCANGNPLNKANWAATNLSPFATTESPSLSTDGRMWCSMVKSSSDLSIHNVCTRDTDPLVKNSWRSVHLSSFATHVPQGLGAPKECKYAGERARGQNECCPQLQFVEGQCQAAMLPIREENLREVRAECNATLHSFDQNKFQSEAGPRLAVFEHLFSNMEPLASPAPNDALKDLITGSKARKEQVKRAHQRLISEKEKIRNAGNELRNFNNEDQAVAKVARERFNQLIGRIPNNEVQEEYLNLNQLMTEKTREFVNRALEISIEYNGVLQEARKKATNEDWLCQKTTLLNCGHRRWTKTGEELYYIDPPVPKDALSLFSSSLNPGTNSISQSQLNNLQNWMKTNIGFKSVDNLLLGGLSTEASRINNAGEMAFGQFSAFATFDIGQNAAFSGKSSLILETQQQNAFLIKYLTKMSELLTRRMSSRCTRRDVYAGHHERGSSQASEEAIFNVLPNNQGHQRKESNSHQSHSSTDQNQNEQGDLIANDITGGDSTSLTESQDTSGASTSTQTVNGELDSSDAGTPKQAFAFNNWVHKQQKEFSEFAQTQEGKEVATELNNNHQQFLTINNDQLNGQAAFAPVATRLQSDQASEVEQFKSSGLSASRTGELNNLRDHQAQNARGGDRPSSYGKGSYQSSVPGHGGQGYSYHQSSGSGSGRSHNSHSSSSSSFSAPGGESDSKTAQQGRLSEDLTQVDRESILRSINSSQYKIQEDDDLFQRIKKSYIRLAMPRLLK